MTVQFNLIPDIKAQYLKAKRLERLVIGASGVAVTICLVVLALLIVLVDVKGKHDISNLSSKISSSSQAIKSIKGLNDIITVQNQLEALPGLYNQDPKVSRLFGYITQLTPPNVTIGDLSVNLSPTTGTTSGSSPYTIDIKGSAPALSDVNAYTDALKRATYTDQTTGAKDKPAFSSVVLTSFARNNQGATYTIDFNFDSTLFLSTDKIVLSVPKTTTAPQAPGVNGKIFKALSGDQGGQ